jgi:hypothetical protein
MPVFASGDGAVRFAVIGYARKSVDGRLDKLLEQLRVWLEPASRARPPADLAFGPQPPALACAKRRCQEKVGIDRRFVRFSLFRRDYDVGPC